MKDVPILDPGHEALLRASAISIETVAARDYFTARTRARLADLGFATYQRIVPALVLPVWGVNGAVVNYQARPDRPRIDAERGREVKYETIAGSGVRLDCPPACRAHLGSTRRALWVTEGVRKGDALVSAGVCAIALLGVDCFQCGDWDRIALDERHVYVCFDNDVMRKPSVHGALERLARLLTSKGAIVHYVYLPEGEGKIGVDDYLAAGHTVDDLFKLAEDELRSPPAEPKPHRPTAWPAMWLLDSVERLLRRFVRFPSEHEVVALALYVLHTHALDAARATPYMLIVSPEKRTGKTRALEAIELLVREPLRAANISAAGVYQSIEAWTPTLLVDEVDAIFRVRSDQNEALRGVLDAGNRRGSYVVRGTQEGAPAKFGTWSAKVLAGINTGKLPDTIRDRSIVLGMERLADNEVVDDLFPDDDEVAAVVEQLRERLANWAEENRETLTAWRRRERLGALDTRLQEAWDPLLAIADLAGGEWPRRAKEAAIALATGTVDPSEGEHGHLLLLALRDLLTKKSPQATRDLCQAVHKIEELPFSGYHGGGGIQPRDVARLLKPYGVRSRDVWVDEKSCKGYRAEDFAEAWKRYAPEVSSQARGPRGPRDPSADGDSNLADLADLADRNGASATHAHSNGRPRERTLEEALPDLIADGTLIEVEEEEEE
jgi:hypothetical protein